MHIFRINNYILYHTDTYFQTIQVETLSKHASSFNARVQEAADKLQELSTTKGVTVNEDSKNDTVDDVGKEGDSTTTKD